MSASGPQKIDVAALPASPRCDEADKLTDFLVDQQMISVPLRGDSLSILTQQTTPKEVAKTTVLLLHGQSFTSEHWVEIHTLPLVASWGYKAIAVDLPGYGRSENESLGKASNEEFLLALVKALDISTLVLVSPSMSGSFSLPYLFAKPEESLDRAEAFVAVAPVNTGEFVDAYAKSELPTLIVYGENDSQLGVMSLNDLQNLPKSKVACIPNAGHACYMNQPALFHNALYAFLSSL